MKLSWRWLQVAALVALPLILFLPLRSARMDQQRTLPTMNPATALTFVADGKQLAISDSSMGGFSLWDVPSRRRIWKEPRSSWCTITDAFEQDKTLVHFNDFEEMELWDVENRRLKRTVDWDKKVEPGREDLRSAVLSPDGKILVAITWIAPNVWSNFAGNKLRLLDVDTQKIKRVIEDRMDEKQSSMYAYSLPGSTASSPDGKMLATGNADGVISLWDTQLGKPRKKIAAHEDMATVVFSPAGKFLASGSKSIYSQDDKQRRDGELKLWDAQTGALIRTFFSNGSGVTALKFSPDSKKLAQGDTSGNGSVWDVSSGQLLQRLVSHRDAILSLAFSLDAKTLAAGSQDKTVKLWKID